MYKLLIALLVLVAADAAAGDYPWRLHHGEYSTPVVSDRTLGQLKDDVKRVEDEKGIFSPGLYFPVERLGVYYFNKGDYQSAITQFQRMQTLVHRHEGVYSPFQESSQAWMIKTYSRTGSVGRMEQQQQLRYLVAQNSYTPESADMQQARWKLADWYMNTNRVREAREIIDESRANANPDSAGVAINLLRLEARADYLSGRCCASDKLAEITSLVGGVGLGEHVEATVQRLHDSLVFLEGRAEADVYPASAGLAPAYLGFQHAADVNLANDRHFNMPRRSVIRMVDEETVNGPTIIGSPVAVCTHAVKELQKRDIEQTSFNVSVELDEEGRATNISIDGSGKPALHQHVARSIKYSRFRPAFDAEGRPVKSVVEFVQRFDQEVRSSTMVQNWNRSLVLHTCHDTLQSQQYAGINIK